jgi:hypothetical protein
MHPAKLYKFGIFRYQTSAQFRLASVHDILYSTIRTLLVVQVSQRNRRVVNYVAYRSSIRSAPLQLLRALSQELDTMPNNPSRTEKEVCTLENKEQEQRKTYRLGKEKKLNKSVIALGLLLKYCYFSMDF